MQAFLGLGANLGDRAAFLRAGLEGLARWGLPPVALSSVWETEPVDTPEPRWFFNMAVEVDTDLDPGPLLRILLEIEREVGRVRTVRNAPRALDLDLLLHGEARVDVPGLTVPHPRMWSRRFVLEPLAEIAPEVRDPGSGRTVAQALAALPPSPAARRVGALDRLGSVPV